jgi:mRNA interferase RelE/StbE
MALKIIWTDEARADIRSIDRDAAMRIFDGLYSYATTWKGGVKVLKGDYAGRSRLRVGDYRVIFRETGEILRILRVRHRREAYR